MGSFGEAMRRERETRGVTLQSISTTTKIGTHFLEALEKNEFDKLPGGFVNKGFVRSYARFLGMNEEQVLKQFIAVAGDPEQPLPDPPVKRRSQTKQRRSWKGMATVMVCAIALSFGGWKTLRIVRHAAGAAWSAMHRTRSRPAMIPAKSVATNNAPSTSSQPNEPPSAVLATDQPQKAPTTLQLATNQPQKAPTILPPASQPATTSAPALVLAAATTPAEQFEILVRANQPVWVSITADDMPVIEGVLNRKKKIHAYSQVVLKTNNAGALAVSLNGKPLPPLGDQDQPTTVTFSPHGVTRTSTAPGETGEVDSQSLPHVSTGSDHPEPAPDDPQRPQSSPSSGDAPPDT